MQVGKKMKALNQWKLGEKNINIGDTITNDNKNKRNPEIRENKIQGMVIQINTTTSSDIMRGIETKVLLMLYETSIVSSLVHNAESWTLSLSEETQIDMIGIKAIKRLFSLPTSTPSAAVLFNLGLLYITQVVDKMRFLFLHKIINRPNDHWTNQMLKHLQSLGIGWAKSIHEKLNEYELET